MARTPLSAKAAQGYGSMEFREAFGLLADLPSASLVQSRFFANHARLGVGISTADSQTTRVGRTVVQILVGI
jgi:hypothetical protein